MFKKSGYVWVIALLLLIIAADGYYQSQSSPVPIWQTEWFLWRVCAVVAIILGLLYYGYIMAGKKKQKEFEEFKAKVLEAQEKEWKVIAGELHDSIGQNLSAINIFLQQNIKASSNESGNLQQASELVVETIDEVRRISQKLYPKQIERLGLTVSIQAMAERLSAATGIKFDVQIENIDNVLTRENEVQYFRIIQEILNNIIKHSGAKNASIIIKRSIMFITTEVNDDGKGFTVSPSSMLGFGLLNIEERIRIVKGVYDFKSEEGKGTDFKITIPVK
jgi:two-component system, sensor histidine kinase LadS